MTVESAAPGPSDIEPPDDVMVNRRWIGKHRVGWARECNRIMLDNGAVAGATVYQARHRARWRARALIALMVDLEMHPRWQLREHTDRKDGGWVWTVEYLRKGKP